MYSKRLTRSILLLASLICLFSVQMGRAWADVCAELKAEPMAASLIGQLDLARNQNTEALGFRLYDYPILITSQKAPLCVALYSQAKVEYFALAQALTIDNGTYSFRNEINLLDPSDEKQLQFLIQDRKIAKFLIYKITTMSDDYSEASDSLRTHFAFMVHEGFHLLIQSSFFNQSHYKAGMPYVSWTSEGRDFIKKTCFGPEKNIRDMTYSEIALLRQAVVQSFSPNQSLAALDSVRKFLAVRDARYALLKDLKFQPASWSAGETCAQGESEMEFAEGTAEFVEATYLFKAGLLKVSEWVAPRVNKYTGSEYYILGSLQLMILSKLDPQFAELTKAIQVGGEAPAESLYTARLRKLVSVKQKHLSPCETVSDHYKF